jgi:hypothetical protein
MHICELQHFEQCLKIIVYGVPHVMILILTFTTVIWLLYQTDHKYKIRVIYTFIAYHYDD